MSMDVTFTLMGLIGGVAYTLAWAKSYADLRKYESVKALALGAISGFLYGFLHSEMSFPNSVMAFVAGYAGTDFITSMAERFKPKKEA